MDIQDVLNHVYLKEFIDDYNKRTGLSIALSSREHYILSKERKKNINSLEKLLQEELISLSNYTDIPEEIIQSIKEKINDKYLAI